MSTTKRLLVFVGVFVVSTSIGGCKTRFFRRIAKLPNRARVGVLVTNEDGHGLQASVSKSYIHAALMENGVVPMTLNEATVPVKLLEKKIIAKMEGCSVDLDKIRADMRVLMSLKDYFKRKNIQYILVVHVDSSGFDEDLKAVVIRVRDMAIIGSKYYRYRIMGLLYGIVGPLTAGFAWPFIPFCYFRDSRAVNYRLVKEFIAQMR